MDFWNPPLFVVWLFLSLDTAITLPLARFMIKNRRRTSAETQNALQRPRDGRDQVNSGCGLVTATMSSTRNSTKSDTGPVFCLITPGNHFSSQWR